MKSRRTAPYWAAILLSGLAACGGGGSAPSATPTPPPPPPPPSASATDLSNARAANLSATLDAATQLITLQWSDTFPAGTAYAIEQQSSGGSWSSIDSVPGPNGSGATLAWTRTTNTSLTLRVAAQKVGYEVPLDTASGNTSVAVTLPTGNPTIQLDQSQPLAGTANLSIANGGAYSRVAWYVDLNSIGTSTTAPSYSMPLLASNLTAGTHLILARLETAPDSYVELRLTIQVANPEVAVTVGVSGTSGNVYVNVTATSAYGIVLVGASLDGNSLGTLSAPNCSGMGCGATYQFAVNASTAGSGLHTITAIATDGNSVSASASRSVTFSNPPTLTLSTPADGALVNGSLQIAGSFGTDKPGVTVSVAGTLGSVPVLAAASSPFSSTFSLSGVVAGAYTLTVTATDSSGQTSTISQQITVTSSSSIVYPPAFTLGTGGSLLAVNGSNAVYATGNGQIHRHTSSADTILSQGTITNLSGWQVSSDGAVFAQGFGTDRPGGAVSIYLWPAATSTAINLSNAAGSSSIYDQLLPVHYPWVLWASLVSSHWSQYTLYNVMTGENLTIPGPAGVTLVGNNNCDFISAGGTLTLFYWVESQAANLQYTTNVYRWEQASHASTPLSSDGLSLYPQTDGNRVAWQTDHTAPPPNPPYTLSTLALGSNASATLSSSMTSFQLSSGLLGWLEQTISTSANGISTVTAQSIKAADSTTSSTISNLLSSTFFGASGGYVAFEENGHLYDWSVTGGRTLLFDAAPGQVHLTGTTLYFTNGSGQTVYAVPMH